MAKTIGYSISELEEMSIGQVLDQVTQYVEAHDVNHFSARTRRATQSDMDSF